jgi:hypothetical protein
MIRGIRPPGGSNAQTRNLSQADIDVIGEDCGMLSASGKWNDFPCVPKPDFVKLNTFCEYGKLFLLALTIDH